MITFIYQLILFFIIIGTYALMRGGYMDIEWILGNVLFFDLY